MKKIIFRADAGTNIGYGHFTRTLALAEMLKDDFDCYFATVNPTVFQIEEIKKVCELIELPDNDSHFNSFISLLTGVEIVVLDNYFFNEVYQLQLKSKGCKLVCIDDLHDKHFYADLVINQALGISPSHYSGEGYTQYLLGFKYSLLRKEFMVENKDQAVIKKYACFIMIGGSDPYNLTVKILSMLENKKFSLPVVLVVGDGFKNDSIQNHQNNVICFKGITGTEIVNLMQQSEFGILPASTVSMEACAARMPFICGYYIDNQKEMYLGLSKNKLALCVGNFTTVSADVLLNTVNKMSDTTVLDSIRSKQTKLLDKKAKQRFIKVFKLL
jgi:UDP-2,4-diacetamido-2,4,6-trideoxy-beta-L-altropyranose hydrolase